MSSRSRDITREFNDNSSIVVEVGGFDRTSFHVIAPVVGTVYVYGSNNDGSVQGTSYGSAALATDFTPTQVVNKSTGSGVTSITAAGIYEAPVDFQFIKLQGGGASIYALHHFVTKQY